MYDCIQHKNETAAIKTGSHQFEEALGCCVVVSPLIGQVLHAHFIHTLVHKGHETADGLTHIRLCCVCVCGTCVERGVTVKICGETENDMVLLHLVYRFLC